MRESRRASRPIQRFFEEHVQEQFVDSAFLDRGEIRVMVQGSLSAKSNELLQQRIRKLAEEFDALGRGRSLARSRLARRHDAGDGDAALGVLAVHGSSENEPEEKRVSN